MNDGSLSEAVRGLFPDCRDFAEVRARYPLKKLGVGARRVCYRIGDTGYCVKFLRTLADDPCRKLGWKLRRMLKKDRFDPRRNLNCLEAEAMNRYRVLAGPRIAAALPEVVETVFDDEFGYGVVMSELKNADGSGVESVIIDMMSRKDSVYNRECFRRMRELVNDLIEVSAPFYEADNFVVQYRADGSFALRIIDFEPVGKKLLAPENLFAWYRRWFCHRQAVKSLGRWEARLS